MFAGGEHAQQPAKQAQQVQAEQAAQGPEQVDGVAFAQGGKGQTAAAGQGQQEQCQQRQTRALQPVQHGTGLAVARGEEQGARFDARGQVAAGLARQAVGLAVLQRAAVLFAQADGFAQPEPLQARAGMWGAVSHAAFRLRIKAQA